MGRHKLAQRLPEILWPTLAKIPTWISGTELHLFDFAPKAQLIHDLVHLPREKQELTLLALSSTWEWFRITEVKKKKILNCTQQPADSQCKLPSTGAYERCVTHNLLSKEPYSVVAPWLIGLNLQRGLQHASSATWDGLTQRDILKVGCKCDNLLKWGWKPKKYR